MCTETEGKRERFEEFNYLTEACYWYALESLCQAQPRVPAAGGRGCPEAPHGTLGTSLGTTGDGSTPGCSLGEAGGLAKWAEQGQRGDSMISTGSVRDSFAPRLGWRGRGSLAREVQMDSAGVRCTLQTPLCPAELQAAESGSGPDPAQRGPARCGARGC